jgi:hypothetical protein
LSWLPLELLVRHGHQSRGRCIARVPTWSKSLFTKAFASRNMKNYHSRTRCATRRRAGMLDGVWAASSNTILSSSTGNFAVRLSSVDLGGIKQASREQKRKSEFEKAITVTWHQYRRTGGQAKIKILHLVLLGHNISFLTQVHPFTLILSKKKKTGESVCVEESDSLQSHLHWQ